MTKATIVVVDDEQTSRTILERFLTQAGFDARAAADYDEAVQAVEQHRPDLVVTDIMLGSRSGIEVLKYVKQTLPACPVIIVTGAPSLDTATDALRHDAFEYITKPVRRENLVRAAEAALKFRQLVDERERYRADLDAMFRGMLDGVVLVDGQGVVQQANDAARALMQGSEERTGRPVAELFRGFSALQQALETATRSCTACSFTRSPWIRGSETRSFSFSISPLRSSNEGCRGAVIVMKDETPMVELERELHARGTHQQLVGKSARMQAVYDIISALAAVDSTALILGESGTGKELVAEAIHALGPRRDKPLIKINCAALPETLLESELFGHVRGAFTGATSDRIGRFQAAEGGSIFLDEIGDISSSLQLRLLRVLQNREIERIGEARPVKVDVRIMAATNRDLRALVKAGKFREDLYYRLKVVEIGVPPLRDRREDIPLLADHFVKKMSARLGKTVTSVSTDALRALTDYDWPGNVRELEHAIERSLLFCRTQSITVDDLPSDIVVSLPDSEKLSESAADDRTQLLEALDRTGWNKSKAARLLGLNRVTIHRKLQKYDIEKKV